MSGERASSRAVALALAPGLLAMLVSCDEPRQAAPAAARDTLIEPPAAPEPVPPQLAAAHDEIQTRLRAKQFQDAAELFPRFLADLEREWGADSPRLRHYVYDYGLALRLSGRERDALRVAARGTSRWPADLQLSVLEATLRTGAAVETGALDPRAQELWPMILREENHPRLRGQRVDIASLHALWADMLFRAQRSGEASTAVEAALALDPACRRARELRARLFLSQQQPAAALAVLEPLIAERAEPALEVCAGMALLDAGKPAEALARLAPLADKPVPASSARSMESYRDNLQSCMARALNELGRHAEAGRLLLAVPRLESEPHDLLQELVKSARGLGAERGAAALDRRLRGLQGRRRLLELALQARAAGFPASMPYYQALAALASHRTGEAAALLERAASLGPTIASIHLERALVCVRLGLLARAEAILAEAGNANASRLLDVARSRVVALRGDAAGARRLLERSAPTAVATASAAPSSGPATIDEQSLVPALEGLAWLELGQPSRVDASAEATGRSLLRAERSILEGQLADASGLLAESFQDVPGGAVWAAALAQLIAVRSPGSADAAVDASDWLDHPRLFADAVYGCPPPLAGRLGELGKRRRDLLSRIESSPGDAAVPLWHELLRLHLDAGAARKAREIAWHLASLRPRGFEEQRALAGALSLDDEVIPRLVALREAARLRPEDTEVSRALRDSLGLLGLQP